MRWQAIVAGLLAVASGAFAEPALMSPSAFRDLYAAAAAAAKHAPTRIVDDRTFSMKVPGGDELTVSIDNAYAQYAVDPGLRDQIVARYVQALTAAASDDDATIDQLVAIVRPTNYLQASLQPGASLENFLSPRPMAGDLSYFLAVDAAASIRSLMPSDLKRWKIDEAAAWGRALANIKARMGDVSMIRLDGEDGASGVGASSGLAPSILATPAMCGPDARDGGVKGQIVLVIAEDAYLFGVPSDPISLARFWRDAKSMIATNSSLSKTPLTCRDGSWVVVPAVD